MAGLAVTGKLLTTGVVGLGLLVGGLVACSDDPNNLLGNGNNNSGPNNNNGSSDSGGWNNNPTYNADGAAQAPLAKQLFASIEPQLVMKCGGACHQLGTTLGAPTWLAGPDDYKSVTTYPGIIVADVYASKLENRPQNHPAACLVDPGNETLLASVTTWLTAEAANLTQMPLAASTTVDPATGSVNLSGAATGINGAKITFTATQQNDLLKFQNVMLVAPAGSGIHIVSPIFAESRRAAPRSTTRTTRRRTSRSRRGSPARSPQSSTSPGGRRAASSDRVHEDRVGHRDGERRGDEHELPGPHRLHEQRRGLDEGQLPQLPRRRQRDSDFVDGFPGLNSNNYATACTQARTQVNTGTPSSSNVLLAPLQMVAHPVKVFASTGATGYQQIQTWVNKE